MDLRALDDRLLPVLAARLRRLVGRVSAVVGRAGQATHRTVDVLRGRPVVSVAALAVLVGAVTFAAVTGKHSGSRPVVSPGAAPVGYADIGPTAGQRVADYVKAARHRLAAAHEDRQVYAVVDFARYLTVDDVARAVGDLGVVRAYFKAQVRGVQTQPHTAVVHSLAQVASSIASTAKIERSAAASFLQLAGAIPARTPTEQQVKRTYALQAAVAKVEGRTLTAHCTCVYALVVHGPVPALRALAARPGVRVVDPAPGGIPVDGLGVIPLLPETTGLIPVPGRPVPPH